MEREQQQQKWGHDIRYNDTQQNDTRPIGLLCDTQRKRHPALITLGIRTHSTKCLYAEFHIFIVMLIVVRVNDVVLNVVAPQQQQLEPTDNKGSTRLFSN